MIGVFVHEKFLKEIMPIISLAIFINILHGSIISFAWGDSNGGRPSYSLQEVNEGKLGNNIVFNSITIAESDYAWYREHYGKEMPVGTITHEKNYVGAREDTGKNEGAYNVWQGNDIKVEDGKTYIVRLYVHNNNPNGLDAIARNTKVYFNIPTESAMQVKVNGYIHADNANPTDYIDYINFNSDHAFHLEYVYGSALIESNGKVGGSTLNDNIVSPSTGGVLIGYDALDGNVPGCYQYSSYITIKVKAVYDNEFYVENKVRLADLNSDPSWKNEVDANIGVFVLEDAHNRRNTPFVFLLGVGIPYNLTEKKLETSEISPLCSVISTKNASEDAKNPDLVVPAGVEPAISWMRTRRPRPLDDETIGFIVTHFS